MPTVTVNNVVSEAQSMLNDVGQSLFTLAILLPFINKAYDELQNDLIDNGVQVLNEISATLSITAGTTTINPQSVIGTNFVEPVRLQERDGASTNEDDWVDMDEQDWEPSEAQQTVLGVWVWREQQINFRGATTDRDVRVFYHKALSVFTVGGDAVGIERAKTFLAARTAALAAGLIGENWSRAEALQADADKHKEILLSIYAKKRQNIPKRRRALRRPRRRILTS